MPRYLEPKILAQLLRAKEPSPKLFDKLGIEEEKARTLRRQWFAKIHGRCQTCDAEKCKCAPVRTGDNRDPVKLLKQLPEGMVLDRIECRSCFQLSAFTVRNALWRLSCSSDHEAFFKCLPCHDTIKGIQAMKKRRKEAIAKMPPERQQSLSQNNRYRKRPTKRRKVGPRPQAQEQKSAPVKAKPATTPLPRKVKATGQKVKRAQSRKKVATLNPLRERKTAPTVRDWGDLGEAQSTEARQAPPPQPRSKGREDVHGSLKHRPFADLRIGAVK